MESVDRSDNIDEFGFAEPRIDVAWFTMQWKERFLGEHGASTARAVNLIFNVPVWEPKKQHAAMLYKLIGFRFVLKLLMQLCIFGFQCVIVFCKPLVFAFKMCQLIAEQKESFSQNGGPSVFSDEAVDLGNKRDLHNVFSSIERQ